MSRERYFYIVSPRATFLLLFLFFPLAPCVGAFPEEENFNRHARVTFSHPLSRPILTVIRQTATLNSVLSLSLFLLLSWVNVFTEWRARQETNSGFYRPPFSRSPNRWWSEGVMRLGRYRTNSRNDFSANVCISVRFERGKRNCTIETRYRMMDTRWSLLEFFDNKAFYHQ